MHTEPWSWNGEFFGIVWELIALAICLGIINGVTIAVYV